MREKRFEELYGPVLKARATPLPTKPIKVEENRWEELFNILKCSICQSVLSSPVRGKECRHRFCRSCIDKSLSEQMAKQKSCPTCRMAVSSRRYFEKDKLFELLLGTWNLKELEEKKLQNDDVEEFPEVDYAALHRQRTSVMIKKLKQRNQGGVPVENESESEDEEIIIPKSNRFNLIFPIGPIDDVSEARSIFHPTN